jgi:antitoxin MazE
MLTRIQKWGNSQGVRVPAKILQAVHAAVGDEVQITVDGERIVLEPSRRIRGKYRLEDLVARMPVDYEPEEVDWGPPEGREAW